jgi:outer membrane protein assembly factor BamB
MWTQCLKTQYLTLLAGAWLAALVSASPIVADQGWTAFQNGGQLKCDTLPDAWDAAGKNIAWKISIDGYGQSSPVVFHDQVFLTFTSGPNKEKCHVAAYDLKNGTKRWQQDFTNPTPEESNNYISRAAPTPAVDARGVIVSFEGGLVIALSQDGTIRWQKNLVENYGPIKARHGLSASLEQNDEHLFVWVEREGDPYVLALQKDSGDVVWKTAGVGSTSWSSPRLIAVGGSSHLVCSASGRVAGYDAKTGNKLWEFTDIANNTTCTPIPVGDGLFIIGASDGRGEQPSGTTAASSGLIEIQAGADGKYTAGYKWRAEKATCSFGSPIVAANKVWLVNRSGVLYQLDLDTGKQVSAERISAGSVWATPLATDNRLYLFGKSGVTSIVDLANASEITTCTTWEQTAETGANSMGGAVLYAAVTAGDALLIRRGDALYAVRQSGKQ